MAKFITALDTISGQVAQVPESYLSIEGFSDHLVQVDPSTKSYEPTKYKPQTADEWRATHVEKVPAKAKTTGLAETEPTVVVSDNTSGE